MQEKSFSPLNGFIALAVQILMIPAFVYGAMFESYVFIIGSVLIFSFLAPGYFIVQPNQARALLLFGKYKGSVKQDGFFWVLPFYSRRPISLRARNLDTKRIKVNDKNGNPIIISAVVVWRVSDTAKALFSVDDALQYVDTQSEAAVRAMAGQYAYDNFEDDNNEPTLRTEAEVVNKALEKELTDRLSEAGVEIMEARINHLAYAEEIASAMLQRQQANAVVAARREIVEGAVGMVEMALQQLSERELVELDNEKKAAMVSNLLVVLSGDQQATPVVNTGTLHQ